MHVENRSLYLGTQYTVVYWLARTLPLPHLLVICSAGGIYKSLLGTSYYKHIWTSK